MLIFSTQAELFPNAESPVKTYIYGEIQVGFGYFLVTISHTEDGLELARSFLLSQRYQAKDIIEQMGVSIKCIQYLSCPEHKFDPHCLATIEEIWQDDNGAFKLILADGRIEVDDFSTGLTWQRLWPLANPRHKDKKGTPRAGYLKPRKKVY